MGTGDGAAWTYCASGGVRGWIFATTQGSRSPGMTFDHASQRAVIVREMLAPFCERCEIAGSVRRRKAGDIKDIELVILPSPQHLAKLAAIINTHFGRPSKGVWPAKYTQINWECKLDIFTATEANWPLILFIRTGPAAYVQKALADWKRISKGGYSE